jgi:hypothetical protein
MRSKLMFASTLLVAGAARAEPTTDVFFDFDSDVLRPEAPAQLEAFAEQLEANPRTRIVIAGHADATGSAVYNVVLSSRRAESVRRALIYRGIDGDRVVVAIYGEDAPRRGSAREDRRVTVSATDQPLYEIVDRNLGVATAVMWSQPVTVAELEGPRAPTAVSRR